MTIRGCPRLIIDISDCQYIPSGAFEKWVRKCEDSDKYYQIRGRMQDLDVETQGKIVNRELSENTVITDLEVVTSDLRSHKR